MNPFDELGDMAEGEIALETALAEAEAQDDEDPLGGASPLTYIVQCLTAKAEGRDVDEERLQYAVGLSAVATLMDKGLDMETAIAATESAMSKGDIRVAYSNVEGLTIEFGEGVVKDGGREGTDA